MSTSAMLAAAVNVLATTPRPSPSGTPMMPEEMTSATVTPGLPGFFVFFFMAIALGLLLVDMSRRIRRSSAREAVEQRMRDRQEQRRSEAEGAGADDAASDSDSGSGDGEPDRHEVTHEADDGEGVEDFVEPEPGR
ncbi:MAG: hypothetical protein Q4G21_01420 [Dermabacter sp.]|nr:hypothetical protein [Dermabacter sp.]